MRNINRNKYHELNQLLWDMHQKFIEPKLALELYEKRWGYVNQDKLIDEEKKLISRLTDAYGNGFFMPAVN
ncbi:hypothetical protein [Psychromonas sp. SR45-3]|uniref:hypothetical protein n=1 Tax=Psychromonas sp. SR45-3 TaxID=2760930 RepID=UPI0015FA2CE5|nr:hypothetical protein [Psychromonas sp. SR45-3]MBB1272505.1 hypothetical protein [Psychromonas sp. SR45-3]